MPTFDFQCLKCDHVFEYTRPFGSQAKPSCPKCKSRRTEKLISAPAIVFKGDGFYATDSRAKPVKAESKPAEKEKKESKSVEKKTEKKTKTEKKAS